MMRIAARLVRVAGCMVDWREASGDVLLEFSHENRKSER